MHQGLNIPLQSTATRRSSWRVVWILLLALLGLVIFWSIFALTTRLDSTSGIRPADAASTLQFELTPSSRKALFANASEKILFPEHPWTVGQALQWSTDELSLHFDNVGNLSGITIDGELSEREKNGFVERNFSITEQSNRTLVQLGEEEDIVNGGTRLHFSALLPWRNGQYFAYTGEEVTKTWTRLSEDKFIVRQRNAVQRTPFRFPEQADILANISLKLADLSEKSSLPTIVQNTALAAFLQTNSVDHVQIGSFLINGELGTSVFLPLTSVDVDTLALLGQEMMTQKSIDLYPKTLDDETVVLELRGSEDINSTILTENGLTTILLESPSGDILRITQNESGVIVTDQPPSETLAPQPPASTCDPKADQFIRVADLATHTWDTPPANTLATAPIYTLFNEVAVTNTRISYCW